MNFNPRSCATESVPWRRYHFALWFHDVTSWTRAAASLSYVDSAQSTVRTLRRFAGPVGRPNVRNHYKFTGICMPCMLTRSISRVIYEICFWKSKQHRFIAAYIDKMIFFSKFSNEFSSGTVYRCKLCIHCSSKNVVSVCIFRKTISVNSSVFFFSLQYFQDPFNYVCFVVCIKCATVFLLFIHIYLTDPFKKIFWGGVLKCTWQNKSTGSVCINTNVIPIP